MKHLIEKQLIRLVKKIARKYPNLVAYGTGHYAENHPFGADYSNDTFTIRTTCFNPDCRKHDRNIPNFYTEDLEIWWYKWIGHHMVIHTEIMENEIVKVFDKCLKSIK